MTRSSSLEIRQFSIEYVKGFGFLSFARNYKKQLMDTELDCLKNASRQVINKAAEFLENKIADAVTHSNDDEIEKQEPLEEIIIPLEKRGEILNKFGKAL